MILTLITKTPFLSFFILIILILLNLNLFNLYDYTASNNSNLLTLTIPTILSVHCPLNLFKLQITSDMTPSQKHRMKKKMLKWETVSECKDITVYGSNLGFGMGYSKSLTKHVYFMYAIPSAQLELIIGLILGDAWLIIDKKKVDLSMQN